MQSAFRWIAGSIGVFALVLQYWVVAAGPASPPIATWTINFFSFFTILTNCLAACAMLLPVATPNAGLSRFFARPTVRTAIAGYIIIVATVYVFVLRQLGTPAGWGRAAEQLLHYVTPVLFVLDWLLFVPKGQTGWRLISRTLLFPLAYMIWTLAHGALTNWYPYPFVDATKLGYATVFRNFAALTLVFVAVAATLIAVDKFLARKSSSGDQPATT